jgi:transcriptional regulator with XRE-family HTH domain
MPKVISDAHAAFGARVRARRNDLKMSQEQLGDDTGIHWSYIGRVERGQNNIALTNLLRIADALHIDPTELVRNLKPPPRPVSRGRRSPN